MPKYVICKQIYITYSSVHTCIIVFQGQVTIWDTRNFDKPISFLCDSHAFTAEAVNMWMISIYSIAQPSHICTLFLWPCVMYGIVKYDIVIMYELVNDDLVLCMNLYMLIIMTLCYVSLSRLKLSCRCWPRFFGDIQATSLSDGLQWN